MNEEERRAREATMASTILIDAWTVMGMEKEDQSAVVLGAFMMLLEQGRREMRRELVASWNRAIDQFLIALERKGA